MKHASTTFITWKGRLLCTGNIAHNVSRQCELRKHQAKCHAQSSCRNTCLACLTYGSEIIELLTARKCLLTVTHLSTPQARHLTQNSPHLVQQKSKYNGIKRASLSLAFSAYCHFWQPRPTSFFPIRTHVKLPIKMEWKLFKLGGI